MTKSLPLTSIIHYGQEQFQKNIPVLLCMSSQNHFFHFENDLC